MGVSTDTGSAGIDINAVIEGGPSFMQRLAQLAEAKKEHDKALEELNLGKSAIVASNEAARLLAQAKETYTTEMAAFEAEVTRIQSEVNTWSEATKAEATTRLYAAQQALDEAKSKQEAADVANKAAQITLKKAQTDAGSLVSDAQAKADEIVADAVKQENNILAAANASKTKADALVAEMAALKAKYEEAARALKGALT